MEQKSGYFQDNFSLVLIMDGFMHLLCLEDAKEYNINFISIGMKGRRKEKGKVAPKAIESASAPPPVSVLHTLTSLFTVHCI